MNAQLKYADKRGSICAVIQGSNEREKGEVAIRDLILGAELASSAKDRADYLELRAKASSRLPRRSWSRPYERFSPATPEPAPFTFPGKTSRSLRFRLLNSFRLLNASWSEHSMSRAVTPVQNPADLVATHLVRAGYARCEPPILQPASIFFDSGEDLRGQLYLTSDLSGAEYCLRPE